MPYQVASGLFATRSNAPDMTFTWSAKEDGQVLKVSVHYGGGTDTSNILDVDIPWGNSDEHNIGPGKNPSVEVKGTIRALWGDADANKRSSSYVVTFSGDMVRGGVNNIVSSNQKATDGQPVIVYAHLS